jgi:hypothetical protein
MFEDLQLYLLEATLDAFGDIEYPVGRDRIVEIQKVTEKALSSWVSKNCRELDSGGWKLSVEDEYGDCLCCVIFAEFSVSVLYSHTEESLDIVPVLGHFLFPGGRPERGRL